MFDKIKRIQMKLKSLFVYKALQFKQLFTLLASTAVLTTIQVYNQQI